MILPALLLLAATTRLDLVDEVYRIPPKEWRYVELELKQVPVSVICQYDAEVRGPQVRLALMDRQDLKRMSEDEAHGVLSVTPAGTGGRIFHIVRTPGNYVVVVDNRNGDRAAAVHLRVALDFTARHGPAVTYLSPQRRWAVVAISFGVFFAIVTWSARRLLRAVR
jgi:hypothetical protein